MTMTLVGPSAPEKHCNRLHQYGAKTMLAADALRSALANLWTMSDLMRLFQRSEQTINIWIRDENLPVVRIPGERRDTIRFDRGEVLTWARAEGRRIFLTEPAEAGAEAVAG